MTKKEFKEKLLESKTEELLSLELTEEYLIYRINKGEKKRKDNLKQVQDTIKEHKKQIKFFKKWK